MRKCFKFCFVLSVCALVLAGLGVGILRLLFPPEKIKKITLEYARNTLHREVTFEKVSFNLIGITLTNFALSENDSFEQGTFLQAKRLQAKMAFWPLLKKRVEIATLILDGLDLNLIQRPDASFNFDSLVTSNTPAGEPSEKSADTAPFVITADHLSANDCNLNYHNQQTGLSTGLNHLNIQVENFDLNKIFPVTVSFVSKTQENNGPAVSVPVDIELQLFLAGLEMSKAYAQVTQAQMDYKSLAVVWQGKVENFVSPSVNLTGAVTGLNHTVFADFLPDLPAFTIPKIDLTLQADTDLQTGSAQIHQAALRILNNAFTAQGTLNWGEEPVTYRLKGNLQADLAQVVKMAHSTEFNPQGTLNGRFTATHQNNGNDVSGALTLKNISALYGPFTLAQTNGTLVVTSLENMACDNLTGLLNGEKFSSSFSYQNKNNIPDVKLNLQLDKLVLSQWPSSQDTPAQEKAASVSASASNEPKTYMNLTTHITVGPVQIPYFRTDGLTLQTALTNLSESMSKTNGTVLFTLQPGAVTDIDKLLKQNKMARIILLPLSLLNSVGQKLNLDLFEKKDKPSGNEIALTKGEGSYTFTNGLMRIDATTFESALTNLNATGTINFAADTLNMKASATLVTKQTPVVFKITGTLDNPSGKLDVSRTVTSVLGGILNYKAAKAEAQSATANTEDTLSEAAQTAEQDTAQSLKETAESAKAAAKALGSLFKKNKKSSAQ